MTKNSINLREIVNQIMARMPQVKLRAFTLAEVLITLIIIGVVSVLVLPTVINKVQGYANKRAHQVFTRKMQTALQLMQGANSLVGYQTTEQFVEQLKKYIKIGKICDNEHLMECFPYQVTEVGRVTIPTKNELKYADLNALDEDALDTNVNGIILQDGTNILIAYNSACKTLDTNVLTPNLACISMVYDINGDGNPNVLSSSTMGFSSTLGEREDNSNVAKIKDVGLWNATRYFKNYTIQVERKVDYASNAISGGLPISTATNNSWRYYSGTFLGVGGVYGAQSIGSYWAGFKNLEFPITKITVSSSGGSTNNNWGYLVLGYSFDGVNWINFQTITGIRSNGTREFAVDAYPTAPYFRASIGEGAVHPWIFGACSFSLTEMADVNALDIEND